MQLDGINAPKPDGKVRELLPSTVSSPAGGSPRSKVLPTLSLKSSADASTDGRIAAVPAGQGPEASSAPPAGQSTEASSASPAGGPAARAPAGAGAASRAAACDGSAASPCGSEGGSASPLARPSAVQQPVRAQAAQGNSAE